MVELVVSRATPQNRLTQCGTDFILTVVSCLHAHLHDVVVDVTKQPKFGLKADLHRNENISYLPMFCAYGLRYNDDMLRIEF